MPTPRPSAFSGELPHLKQVL